MSERVGLRAGDLALELAPAVGGAIAAFRSGSTPLMREAPADLDDALDAACFPLVPFCNRVRDGRFTCDGREIVLAPNMPGERYPLHGQGWRSPWRVERAAESAAELVFDHAPDEWPWAYEARQGFRLDPGGLDYVLSARNTSDRPMPCGLGIHPYFPSDPQTVLSTGVGYVWTIDEEIMPVERVPATGRYDLHERRIDAADLDNGYDDWSGRAEIRGLPGNAPELVMSSPDGRRFQVYSPKSGGVFVAEPVTNANDALSRPQAEWPALGIALLAPGERTMLRVRIDVRRRA